MTESYLALHVVPRSRHIGLAVEGETVRVWVAAAPERGAANAAALALLAEGLDVSPSALQIVAGSTRRRKLVAVDGLDARGVLERLRQTSRVFRGQA